MRRKKGRSMYSFHAMIQTEAITMLWTTIFSLCLLAVCMCDDAIVNTKYSTISGHVISTERTIPSNHVFANHSKELIGSHSTDYHFGGNQSNANYQQKRTFIRSGNELWDGLVGQCLTKPTFSCFQKNVYTYLDNTLKLEDVNVTERIQFKKIDIDPNVLAQLQNITEEDNEIEKEGRGFESESPIEEVTDALYGKARSFMMTHNLELKLPEMLFDGATFRITPRSFEGDGALVKLEMIPKGLEGNQPTGRFLLKKIKKFFKNKLILSFLAIILVIKLIKIKIFWILPLIVGVTAAKKLLLKFVLFLFPALSHLFKLCSYYHKNYHETKFHLHKHQINHLHTVVPPWYKDFAEHRRPELIYSAPPKNPHPVEYIHSLPPPSLHQHQPSNWEYSGPGLGSEYISDIHRNINVNPSASPSSHLNANQKHDIFNPKADDADTISSWGLDPQTKIKQPQSTLDTYLDDQQASLSTYHPATTIESSIGRTPIDENTLSGQPTIYSKYIEPSSQHKFSPDKYEIAEKIQHAIQQQSPYAPSQSLVAVDPFYGPIVVRIDSILTQYSTYLDENCKEWLVCNMYKSPVQFSPHSNFLSAELSRDSSELQKPAALNSAVLAFYRYVKAARDGQDQKNCESINPKCA